ncbi:dicarboxylate/amino acid:cation symporter [Altererythrobacter sp. CC-YST694]|uniref:dicarboxylate/amino acid:cation symporter n=1 Tax=Altererythrobacter sp. CC-YST694 TaxID=2755038 RepID=UPI001D014661|nr:cation:dicarboxylase symporter family transporter [Altererythrobacter sp. CC-YST694]
MPLCAANVTRGKGILRGEVMEHREAQAGFEALKLPVWWTFGGLAIGLGLGVLLGGSAIETPVLDITETVGNLWLRALQMTIIPLVAALLVTGISRMVETASAGQMARRTIFTIFAVLACGTLFSALATPLLLEAFPIPVSAGQALAVAQGDEVQAVPGIAEFIRSLVAPNLFAAAAENAMLPLVLFFALFGVAVAKLPDGQRQVMAGFFAALGNAMLIIIGWILWLAPAGVFALAIGVAARAGAGAFLALGHYILVVASMGVAVLIAAYPLALLAGRKSLGEFARAILPAQAVAISTQSSLASLPAMLAACRQLGIRETSADFVLPLAVAIFRATSPAMNLAVAIYVAKLTGVPLTPATLTAGAAVALVTTIGSVSLPGTISFVASVGPIALAMGVPIGPLALLVAVEMLPDIVRTLGNVSMDVAVSASVDHTRSKD